MASRKEEKEQRKRERLARERELEAAAQRNQRLRVVGGGVLAVAAVTAIVIAATAGGGGGSSQLVASARAAGCELRSYPNFGQEHTTAKVTYKSNPPTSGPHNPVPADDGIYDAGGSPPVGKTVHALEHGRVEVQWRPGLPAADIAQLQKAVNAQNGGRHSLVFENQTGMPYQVAASAWQHLIGCPRFTPAVLSAIRDFRTTYTDTAPEKIP